jgi:hypothetical protein
MDISGEIVRAAAGVAFGCGWAIAGATALPRRWRAWAAGLSIGVSAALVATPAGFHPPRPAGVFRGNVYGWAVVLETVGILSMVWLLRRLPLTRFLLPSVGFIVGLHFIGLWKATDLPRFLWTAAATCIVCVSAAFLPD